MRTSLVGELFPRDNLDRRKSERRENRQNRLPPHRAIRPDVTTVIYNIPAMRGGLDEDRNGIWTSPPWA